MQDVLTHDCEASVCTSSVGLPEGSESPTQVSHEAPDTRAHTSRTGAQAMGQQTTGRCLTGAVQLQPLPSTATKTQDPGPELPGVTCQSSVNSPYKLRHVT